MLTVFVLVPLILQLFLSSCMDMIWGLFNMLQLVANQKMFMRINFPASLSMALTVLDSTVNFKATENEFVKTHIMTHAGSV